MTKNKHAFYDLLLKIFAIIIPFYMIFYNQMYEHPENQQMKALRKFVWIGFGAYALLFLAIYVVKSGIV